MKSIVRLITPFLSCLESETDDPVKVTLTNRGQLHRRAVKDEWTLMSVGRQRISRNNIGWGRLVAAGD